MSALGHSRRFVHATRASALPSAPDVLRHRSEAAALGQEQNMTIDKARYCAGSPIAAG